MTVAQRFVLDELDRDGVEVSLDAEQAAMLADTGLVEVRPERRGWRLLPRGMVGSVRIDGLQIDVRPKVRVGLTRLLFLLGYARNPRFIPDQVDAVPEADLWPALAETLERLARAALRPGVLQGYRTIDESRRTVRGRIRIGDQLSRHPGQMLPIEVTHDEFTRDIAENRILRAALRRMLAVPGLHPRQQASLRHLEGKLVGVHIPAPGAPLPPWQPTRLNRHYFPALRLAELILANASTETGAGSQRIAAFVVDMARVYEDFVTAALREALRRVPGSTQAQYPTRLDVGEGPAALPMLIDLVHLRSSRPRVVFDAKYKAADGNGRYPNADHYQMLAYCIALKVPIAWLVYADAGPRRTRRIVHTGIAIVEYPLDLSAEPRALLDRIDRLARTAIRLSRKAQHGAA
jgi:5-methylcytosine-specific restriction enzyme subunit McrC